MRDDSSDLLGSPMLERHSQPRQSQEPNPIYMSANFSTESLERSELSGPETPQTGKSPALMLNQNTTLLGRLNANNGSSHSLLNSPVGQPSFSHHQRTSSALGTRPRPRSMFGAELLTNAIYEDNLEDALLTQPARSRNSYHSAAKLNYTPAKLTPPVEPRRLRSRPSSPSRGNSPIRKSHRSPTRSGGGSPVRQPFNFKLQDLQIQGSPLLVAKPAHRKGHRYKHSSVSMNMFQEPLPMADTALQLELIPDLYPIPNANESMGSATPQQRARILLSFGHFLTSAVVFLVGTKTHQPALSTLAHLVFYDSLGSVLVAAVDVMSNFEVWSKPSIVFPFGLGRIEVLMGFALSTSLVMVGCDLVSHFVEELVVSFVDSSHETEHGNHHIHAGNGEGVSWLAYELVLLLVLAITLITTVCVFDVGPISSVLARTAKGEKALSDALMTDAVPSDLRSSAQKVAKVFAIHPIRLLTLAYLVFLALVPIIPQSVKASIGFDINELSTLIAAFALCYIGWKVARSIGGVLLISFPFSEYDYDLLRATIMDNLLSHPSFKLTYTVNEVLVTKLNYQLYVAGAAITMSGGSVDDESRLIFETNRIIQRCVESFERDSVVETTVSIIRK